MAEIKTRLGPGGRIVIPAAYRKAMGVTEGDDLTLILEGEEVRVLTPREAVRRAQALVRRYVPRGKNLSDELIRDRRREGRRE
jgi:AbrB family looped-hinge helix DNA binding protein